MFTLTAQKTIGNGKNSEFGGTFFEIKDGKVI